MRLAPLLTAAFLLATPFTRAQQANLNLDWDPHRDAEALRPHTMFVGLNPLGLFGSFGVPSAGDTDPETSLSDFLATPDVNVKIDDLFVGLGSPEAAGRFGERSENLRRALVKHGVEQEYYATGYGAHDWATWRHLLHERFLPNLWRNQ